jgi:uncharacterized membrane protein
MAELILITQKVKEKRIRNLFSEFLFAWKNVPLNKKLADFDFTDTSCRPGIEWNDYYKNWIKWNHIRTVSCFLSMVLLIIK